MDYTIKKNYSGDKELNAKINALLKSEGIMRDKNLDYTCAIINENGDVIATGSSFKNTLRCLCVKREYQGEGLLNKIITHLINLQFERGNNHIFIYTKFNAAKFFYDLGFYEIISDKAANIAFMENKSNGFKNYLKNLINENEKFIINKNFKPQKSAAIVMNANPFTLGHLYLIERAASENDILNLFIVSEDASEIPFNIRKKLVLSGTAHLKNIIYHDSGDYIISGATFPSYFQRDEESVIKSHAVIDVKIFMKIALELGINARYAGEEPFSAATAIYNKTMAENFANSNIKFIILKRKELNGEIISASRVREFIKLGDIIKIKDLVPPATYDYFMSDEAQEIIKRIRG